jgi:hypothetical protein
MNGTHGNLNNFRMIPEVARNSGMDSGRFFMTSNPCPKSQCATAPGQVSAANAAPGRTYVDRAPRPMYSWARRWGRGEKRLSVQGAHPQPFSPRSTGEKGAHLFAARKGARFRQRAANPVRRFSAGLLSSHFKLNRYLDLSHLIPETAPRAASTVIVSEARKGRIWR